MEQQLPQDALLELFPYDNACLPMVTISQQFPGLDIESWRSIEQFVPTDKLLSQEIAIPVNFYVPIIGNEKTRGGEAVDCIGYFDETFNVVSV